MYTYFIMSILYDLIAIFSVLMRREMIVLYITERSAININKGKKLYICFEYVKVLFNFLLLYTYILILPIYVVRYDLI